MTNQPFSRTIDVSIIIVSWNVAGLLGACLQSVLASPLEFDSSSSDGSLYTAEIIVVDSASADNTLEMLSQFSQVKVMPQSINVGFPRGNNIGFEVAQGRYLLMLNPDTQVIGDVISGMIDYLDTHNDVGVIGPKTLNSDGSYQSTKRHFYDRKTAFFESTMLQPYAPQAWLDYFYAQDVGQDDVADVDWVQGSALMVRHELYKTLGGLDEGYVMYSEEMDWCKRIRDHGWRVVYWGHGEIIHHGGKSSEQAGALKHIYFQTSKIRYMRKHFDIATATFLRMFLILTYAIQYFIEASKYLLGHKRDLRRHRMSIYSQVIRSGLR